MSKLSESELLTREHDHINKMKSCKTASSADAGLFSRFLFEAKPSAFTPVLMLRKRQDDAVNAAMRAMKNG